MFSRYYGETAKQIAQIFRSISDMALDDSPIVVILDSVYSVASSRAMALQQSELADIMRVTQCSYAMQCACEANL
jgi:ATP-dependent 26S proteasome regulatory subunit